MNFNYFESIKQSLREGRNYDTDRLRKEFERIEDFVQENENLLNGVSSYRQEVLKFKNHYLKLAEEQTPKAKKQALSEACTDLYLCMEHITKKP